MPMSWDFKARLLPKLPEICRRFGTPFHVYDEAGILEGGARLKAAFASCPGGFGEFFAVKANPNLVIMERLLRRLGFGFDCSSIPELVMARLVGAKPQDIMFTSNNTSQEELLEARKNGGCVLNLDDITFVRKIPPLDDLAGLFSGSGKKSGMPELICFRYNPGERRDGGSFIGKPQESKYGVRHDQIVAAYRLAQAEGAQRFGLHTMVCSNSLSEGYLAQTVEMLLDVAAEINAALGITFEFINMGGGLGIPYHPEHRELKIEELGRSITSSLHGFQQKHGWAPKLLMESGRWITGPHGVLVTRCINRMSKHFEIAGVDACMSSLMRPAVYDAYHHLDVLDGKGNWLKTSHSPTPLAVVGALCENWDQFTSPHLGRHRLLPEINEGDLAIIHDTGAHGHAMGFNYNGRLRPQELLLQKNGSVVQIRRAETVDDYLRTQQLEFPPRLTF